MNLHSQAKSMLVILIVCAISGLISGMLVTQDFYSIFSGSGWGMQLGPGLVFGLLFSITSVSAYLWNKDHKVFGSIGFVFLFTIASTLIYFIAFQIAFWLLILIGNYGNDLAAGGLADLFGAVAISISGGLAGLFGAGALSLTTKFLSKTGLNFRDEILTTITGTVAGILFLWGEGSLNEVNWSLRFVIWQVAVGWSLSRSIQKGITLPDHLMPGNNTVPDPQQSASES